MNKIKPCFELTLPENLISKIVDASDRRLTGMKRARVYFKNGFRLSIIQGKYSYGGNDGLFEIAAFDKSGKMNGNLVGTDDVLGYLSLKEVNEYIDKLANLD
jgi:hypothetical protein